MKPVYPRVMTVAEVAEFLRIGKTTAYELIKEGDIPSMKVGRQVRIFRDDLMAYVRSTRTIEK